MPMVLVVEQDESYCQRITEALSGEGIDVTTVSSMEEGLREAEEHPPDLLLASASLPDVRSLLSRFSQAEGGPGAVVMIPTTLVGRVDASDYRADGILAKPFTLDEVVRAVSDFLPVRPPSPELPGDLNWPPQMSSQEIFGEVLMEVEEPPRAPPSPTPAEPPPFELSPPPEPPAMSFEPPPEPPAMSFQPPPEPPAMSSQPPPPVRPPAKPQPPPPPIDPSAMETMRMPALRADDLPVPAAEPPKAAGGNVERRLEETLSGILPVSYVKKLTGKDSEPAPPAKPPARSSGTKPGVNDRVESMLSSLKKPRAGVSPEATTVSTPIPPAPPPPRNPIGEAPAPVEAPLEEPPPVVEEPVVELTVEEPAVEEPAVELPAIEEPIFEPLPDDIGASPFDLPEPDEPAPFFPEPPEEVLPDEAPQETTPEETPAVAAEPEEAPAEEAKPGDEPVDPLAFLDETSFPTSFEEVGYPSSFGDDASDASDAIYEDDEVGEIADADKVDEVVDVDEVADVDEQSSATLPTSTDIYHPTSFAEEVPPVEEAPLADDLPVVESFFPGSESFVHTPIIPARGSRDALDGEVFGDYTLLRRIAIGGMAEVWQARRRGVEGFQKTVAIKKILAHLTGTPDFITMFIDEAKLAAQLNHANIIQIYDLGKVGDDFFIAMEYVDGRDLRTIMNTAHEKDRRLPWPLALLVAAALARALDYAHRKRDFDNRALGLVHRDVSPQNVLISYEGEIKLCDFGIVKAVAKASTTQDGALKGKLQYMSPEQAWGRSVDARSDIFSLGAVLFEMLTDTRLFTSDMETEILEMVRQCRIRSPRELLPELPEEVERIVLKSLAKEPEERYQKAGDMEEELKAVITSLAPIPSQSDLARFVTDLASAPLAPETAPDASSSVDAADPKGKKPWKLLPSVFRGRGGK